MPLSAQFNYRGKPKPEEEKSDDRIVVLKPGEKPEYRATLLKRLRAWIPARNRLLIMLGATKEEMKQFGDPKPPTKT